MAKNKDIVKITCYGQTCIMDRNKAIAYYHNCERHSEGHEQRRYINILNDLLDGKKECSDRNGDY